MPQESIRNRNDGINFRQYSNGAIATLITPRCHVCRQRNIPNSHETRGVWEVVWKGNTYFICDGCKSHMDHLEEQNNFQARDQITDYLRVK